jgi:alkyl hydroperoxide reductase subunit AhpC
LENKLSHIIAYLEIQGEKKVQERIESNEWHRKREIERIKEEKIKQQIETEKQKVKQLYIHTENWVQACNLRDNYTEILSKGFDVVGVSPDAGKAHLKFIDKYNLPFRLIADIDKKVAEDYGVWGLKKFMGKEYMGVNRTTFIIGDDGSILDVIEKVDTKNHTSQII